MSRLLAFFRPKLVPCRGGGDTPASRGISTNPAAQNKWVRRDQLRRQCVADNQRERLVLKAITKNKLLPEIVQRKAAADMAQQPRDAGISRVRKRCVVTGRALGVLTDFRLARMKFRKLADFGMLSGVSRSSW